MHRLRLVVLALFASLLAAPLVIAMPTATSSALERERFEWDKAAKGRELNISDAAQQTTAKDLEFKRDQASFDRWVSPLSVAVAAAIIGGFFQHNLAKTNAASQRALEGDKAKLQRDADAEKARLQREADAIKVEADRILEMIKTGNPDDAARNLKLLIEAQLITSEPLRTNLASYVEKHKQDSKNIAFLPPPTFNVLPGSGTGLPGGHDRDGD